MGATILKQNIGNKILRQNQGGKILKANYNFGKLFKGSTAIYISVPSLTGKKINTGSIEMFVDVNGPTGGTLDANNSNGWLYSNHFAIGNASTLDENVMTVNLYNNNDDSGQNVATLTMQNTGLNYVSLKWKNRGLIAADRTVYRNSLKITPSSNIIYSDVDCSVFRIAYVEFFGQLTSRRRDGRVVEFRYYDRFIDDFENGYSYQNGLGNEPYSEHLMTHRYKMAQAEILDFSAAQDGSDLRVGVRNYGTLTYGHGEITGLPAGTLEEKAAWANANLFVNFL